MSSESIDGMYSEPDDLSDDFMSGAENEKNPPVPYIKDWHFTVQQHNAPPPTRPFKGDCTVEDVEETNRLKGLQPIERCLKNPPAEGSYGPFSLNLCIHDTMRIGNKHHAQVVVVEVLTAGSPVEGLLQGELVTRYMLIMMISTPTPLWLLISTTPMRLPLMRPFQIAKAI